MMCRPSSLPSGDVAPGKPKTPKMNKPQQKELLRLLRKEKESLWLCWCFMDSNGKAQEWFQRVFDARIHSGPKSLSLWQRGQNALPVKNVTHWHELHGSSGQSGGSWAPSCHLSSIGQEDPGASSLPPSMLGQPLLRAPEGLLRVGRDEVCSLQGLLDLVSLSFPPPSSWCLWLQRTQPLPPSLGFRVSNIGFLLLCSLSAICWVSAPRLIHSQRKDLGIASSEKCLVSPRPTYCV